MPDRIRITSADNQDPSYSPQRLPGMPEDAVEPIQGLIWADCEPSKRKASPRGIQSDLSLFQGEWREWRPWRKPRR
jgi:hypothetical protein